MTIKGLLVTAFVLMAFLLGKDPAIVAASAAAALLITRRVNPQKIYRQIDWDLLVLFIGLFVVIGGVERVGLAQRLFDLLQPVGLHTIAGLSIVTTIVSNVISNVPAVMLLSRLVPHLPDPHTSWLTLAMSSTLAGNLTLVGSIANLIVLEGARRHGVEITFWEILQSRRAGDAADPALRRVVADVTMSKENACSWRLPSRTLGWQQRTASSEPPC